MGQLSQKTDTLGNMVTVHKEDLGACLGIYTEQQSIIHSMCYTQFVDEELGAVLNSAIYGPKPHFLSRLHGQTSLPVLNSIY